MPARCRSPWPPASTPTPARCRRCFAGPVWTGLPAAPPDGPDRRELDLRGGVLRRTWRTRAGTALRSLRFASLARPGVVGLRAEGPADALSAGPALLAPGDGTTFEEGRHGDIDWARTRSAGGGGITAAARQRHHRRGRLPASWSAWPCTWPTRTAPRRPRRPSSGWPRSRRSGSTRCWPSTARPGRPVGRRRRRPSTATPTSSSPSGSPCSTSGVGRRRRRGGRRGPGLTGPVYARPRLLGCRRVRAAVPGRRRTRRRPGRCSSTASAASGPRPTAGRGPGLAGARFPWESAARRDRGHPAVGRPTRRAGWSAILTGSSEEHIIADVAWAARRYADWTGDDAFLRRPRARAVRWTRPATGPPGPLGRRRARPTSTSVIGPDEYHERVDDNAFTNVMARWNLRRAAELAERPATRPRTRSQAWRRLADALVDGYDPATGRLRAVRRVLRPRAAADRRAGRAAGRRRPVARPRAGPGGQVVKQADVLMLHQLVPEEVAPGLAGAEPDYYEPRTAHGSSLSPAIHAAAAGPGGPPDEALGAVPAGVPAGPRRPDRHHRRRPAPGHHGRRLAGPGHGFLGLRPSGDALDLDPCLPEAWTRSSCACATTASACASGPATTSWSWPPTARCRFASQGCRHRPSPPRRRRLALGRAGMEGGAEAQPGSFGVEAGPPDPEAAGRSAGAAAGRTGEAQMGGMRPPRA